MKQLTIALAGILPLALSSTSWISASEPETMQTVTYSVQPIGRVQKVDDHTLIVLDKKYEPGLLGLDGFSHIYIFWWFDRNDTPEKRAVLQVHPRGNRDNPLTGVFATTVSHAAQPARSDVMQGRIGERQHHRNREDRRLRWHTGSRHQTLHSRL